MHHVYCRGNRGEQIFDGPGDCAAFIEKLKELSEKLKVLILAYCLMPNHFHLCLQTQDGGASLSQFMQRLNLWHARQYNRRHQVRGRLNESRFKSKQVHSLDYLRCLVRYIHRNPLRAGLEASVGSEWRFSSHSAYLGSTPTWVATSKVLSLVGSVEAYRQFVEGLPASEADLEPYRFPRRKMPSIQRARAELAVATGQRRTRLERACELFLRGQSLRDIARALGCSKSTVRLMFGASPPPDSRTEAQVA